MKTIKEIAYTKISKKKSNHALYIIIVCGLTISLIVWALGVTIDDVEQVTATPVSAQTVEPDGSELCSLDVVGGPNCPEEQPDGKGGNVEADKAESMLKGTPMAGLGSIIVDAAERHGVDYKLIIGIAEAESNRGKSYVYSYDQNCHNAWGIKPPTGRRADGSYLRCYYEWENGVESIAGLLGRRYKGQTPEEMCGVYVQPCNQNWLRTIKKFTDATNE